MSEFSGKNQILTTARELTGIQHESAADTPMTVTRTGTVYEVKFELPPISSQEFIQFLNQTAPDQRTQTAGGIRADWVFALPDHADRELAKSHSKIPAWGDFTIRASNYVALANDAEIPYFLSNPLQSERAFQSWKAQLPAPQPTSMIVSRWVDDLRILDSDSNLDAETRLAEITKDQILNRFANSPVSLMLKQLSRAGFRDVEDIFRCVIETSEGRKYRNSVTKEVIRRFSKKPFEHRVDVQKAFIAVLADRDDIKTREILENLISNGLSKMAVARGLIPVTDDNGNPSYVHPDDLPKCEDYFGSFRTDTVPADYRELAKEPEVLESGGIFYKRRDMTLRYNSNKRKITSFSTSSYELVDKPWKFFAEPILRWTVDGSRKRDLELVSEVKHDSIDGTQIVQDGVFGLMIAAHLSDDVELPQKLGLRINGAQFRQEQRMGAAQLPLLALMLKNKIMNGSFIESAERAVL
jgi:hypothetical protein